MTQLVYGAIGAAVGFYFGGPTGAQIGWAAGTAIGGIQAAPDVTGPRITDSAVQGSSYGAGISKVEGGDRIAGSLIWADAMRETSHSDSGKGGPTVTTFTYSRSFAVLIGEGVIQSIRRIWADAKLVYDVRAEATTESQAGSNSFASYFTFYDGDEDQLPDPTIETVEGAGNVPAYRGSAYAVFTDLPLGDYGNRIPMLTFEVSNQEVVDGEETDYQPVMVYPWENTSFGPRHSHNGLMEFVAQTEAGVTISTHSTYLDARNALFAHVGRSLVYLGYWTSATLDSIFSTFHAQGGAEDELEFDDPRYVMLAFNVESANVIVFDGLDDMGPTLCGALGNINADPYADDLTYMFSSDADLGGRRGHAGIVRFLPYPGTSLFGYDDVLNNCTDYPPEGGSFPVAKMSCHYRIRVERLLTVPVQSCEAGDPDDLGIAQFPGNAAYCLSADGTVSNNFQYVQESGSFLQLQKLVQGTDVVEKRPLGPVLDSSDPNYADAAYWTAAAAAADVAGTYGVDFPVSVPYRSHGTAIVSGVEQGSTPLSDIVSNVCVECGLTTGQIDVTQLVDNVLGYTRSRPMPGRGALEPLRNAFFFDAVESGDVIRFVKRGGASVASIPRDDLACDVDGSGDDFVSTQRGQESEIPREVTVLYKSITADYQPGTQVARRRVGSSDQQAGVELSIVLDDDYAAKVAESLLYEAWVGRNQRTASTWRKWAKVEPTDVIDLVDGEFTYRVVVVRRNEHDGVIELTCRDDDSATFERNPVAQPVAGGGLALRLDGPTRYALLDIPLLRPDDDSASFYVAANGYLDGWRGALLFQSIDEGASYSQIGELAQTGYIGATLDTLGDYGGGNTFDEANTVRVRVYRGTLQSYTRAQILANVIAYLIGDEIVQALRAVLVDDDTWELSGLLRGRCGTEQHMGSHAVGDRFVVLQPSLLSRPSFSSAYLNQELLYKAVSVGLTLGATEERAFTNTAVALQPLSPVHLNVAPFPSGGYRGTWVRRSRMQVGWQDGFDAPLGEATELYRVRVLNGSTVLEEQTVTSPEVTIGQGSAEVAQVMTLDSTIFASAEVSGGLFGVTSERNEFVADFAVRMNPSTGAVVEMSPTVGDLVFQVAHSPTSMYVSASTLLSNSFPSADYLHRIDYSDFTTIAATRALTTAASRGVAFDGTDLWALDALSNLLRCDPSTLATIDTYAIASPGIGGCYFVWAGASYVWVGASSAREIVKIDPATGAEIGRFAMTAGEMADLIFVGALVFVVLQTVVEARVAATWELVNSIAINATSNYAGRSAALVGDLIVAVSYPDIVLISAATGERLGPDTVAVSAAVERVGGAIGSQPILGCPLPAGGIMSSRVFDLGSVSEAADYSGMTLEVSQVSDTVGPGFPATITID